MGNTTSILVKFTKDRRYGEQNEEAIVPQQLKRGAVQFY